MKKQLQAVLIGAGSRGARAYAPYALEFPEQFKFIAVAEPKVGRNKDFCKQHGIATENSFKDAEDLLNSGIKADVVFICTQDEQHYNHAMLALDKGYDIVLEKPISTSLEKTEAIVKKASDKNAKLLICHVLRYTSFFGSIKKIIDSGEIGDVVSITLNENVGYMHSAHSYVRGNWRNEDLSSPMILAKSCHDMDILYWLISKDCKKVSSFGSLQYYKEQNAPEGSTKRCMDGCKVKESCPFDAEKIYMDMSVKAWPVNVITEDISETGRMKAIKEGPYGRCVYHCDNDVVDRQVVDLEFDGGVVASFAMNSLSAEMNRRIIVYGTKGQLWGEMEKNIINKQLFGKDVEVINTETPEVSEYGHGGGDFGLMKHAYGVFCPEERSKELNNAIFSHRICFAAENSRKNNKIVLL